MRAFHQHHLQPARHLKVIGMVRRLPRSKLQLYIIILSHFYHMTSYMIIKLHISNSNYTLYIQHMYIYIYICFNISCNNIFDLKTFSFRLEKFSAAVHLVLEAEQSFPSSMTVHKAWEHVCYGAVERWHFKMLNDYQRNKAYHDALVMTVQKSDVSSVLDIGCGTGLLRCMLCFCLLHTL